MREIKFRFYDKLASKMREWDYCQNNYKLRVLSDNDDNEKFSPFMQYTGLKDKNGREIYEGDIVECFRESASIVCMKMNAWGLDTNGIGFKAFYEIYGHCEIIGNVYENPELLEGK